LTNPDPSYFQGSVSGSTSAFVYGNESFNPALKPTNSSSLRSRNHEQYIDTTGEIYSSGSERDNDDDDDDGGSQSRSSSPEPYLSDYDDDNWGPVARGERMPRHNRVRQGSEGYEVRPMGNWNVVDPDPARSTNRVDGEREMPWEEDGRYNVYHPDEEWEESDEDIPLGVLRDQVQSQSQAQSQSQSPGQGYDSRQR
jgi:hypothetical protein